MNVKLKRIAKGIKQKDFARMLGISKMTLSRIEKDNYDIRISLIKKFVKFLMQTQKRYFSMMRIKRSEKMNKYIFKAENIEINRPKIFDVPIGSIVIVSNFHFMENQISRIEIEKIKEYPDTVFISLYCGNIQIGDVISKTPYVLDINTAGNVQVYYNLKPVTKFDN